MGIPRVPSISLSYQSGAAFSVIIMPTKSKQPGKAVKDNAKRTPKKETWRKFSEKQVADALKANMGLVMRAARQLGCERNTIYRYIEEYPSCKEAKENGHEMLLDDAEIGLHKSIREQEGWAICFTLKTLGKERGFVEKQITEVSGPNGEPLAPTAIQIIPYVKPDSDPA